MKTKEIGPPTELKSYMTLDLDGKATITFHGARPSSIRRIDDERWELLGPISRVEMYCPIKARKEKFYKEQVAPLCKRIASCMGSPVLGLTKGDLKFIKGRKIPTPPRPVKN
jgi:hypothetical protein